MRGGTDDKGKKIPALIEGFDDFSSDSRVKFVVKMTAGQMANARNQGFHDYFGLTKTMTYTNTMVLFDEFGKLQVYKNTSEVAKNHFRVRKQKYIERHALLLAKYAAESSRASNRARFICETIDKKISIMDLKKKQCINLLAAKGYDSDPVKERSTLLFINMILGIYMLGSLQNCEKIVH